MNGCWLLAIGLVGFFVAEGNVFLVTTNCRASKKWYREKNIT